MNFLALATAFRQESGLSGTGPSTVVAQSGNDKKSVDWVNAAWEDIQNKHVDWTFMWKTKTFNTQIGIGLYDSSATDVSKWDKDSFKIYLPATGLSTQGILRHREYKRFRSIVSGERSNARPSVFTVRPDNALQLDPVPDLVYTITADYYQKATRMAVDSDEPGMPSQFHQVIVWRALMMYAGFDEAGELYSHAKSNYQMGMDSLEYDQRELEHLVVVPQ